MKNSNLEPYTTYLFTGRVDIAVTSDMITILDSVFTAANQKMPSRTYVCDCIVYAGAAYHVCGYNAGGYGTFSAETYGAKVIRWEGVLYNNAWSNIYQVSDSTA